MKIPFTDPRLPRYYVGNARGNKGFFKPFDLDPRPSSTVHGLRGIETPLGVDARYDARDPRYDIRAKAADALSGLGDGTAADFDSSAVNMPAVQNFFTSLLTAYNTQSLLELNIERAARGLAPITAQQVSPGVNLGLTPEAMNMILMLGIGGGALYLATRKKR